jgi:putative transposase
MKCTAIRPKNALDGDAINRLRAIFTNVGDDFEAESVELDGEDNHVHLLANYPARGLKQVASPGTTRPMRRYGKGVLWSPSYFAASCGGPSIGILKAYIEQQRTPL